MDRAWVQLAHLHLLSPSLTQWRLDTTELSWLSGTTWYDINLIWNKSFTKGKCGHFRDVTIDSFTFFASVQDGCCLVFNSNVELVFLHTVANLCESPDRKDDKPLCDSLHSLWLVFDSSQSHEHWLSQPEPNWYNKSAKTPSTKAPLTFHIFKEA